MSVIYRNELAADADTVEQILSIAFGPGRFAKSAYRLREGVEPIHALSFVAELEHKVIGTVRYWPVVIGRMKAVILGPIAITRTLQGKGYALQLMLTSIARARTLGYQAVLLVGDESYYARAGFARIQPYGRITLPGPVDLSRVLGLELVAGALASVSGEMRKAEMTIPCEALGAALAPLSTPASH